MFLLPPVPGLAVYLCAGVLLTPVCEDSMGGFWGAAIYSSFFAYLIKMIAHVMQQKLIGECCGANVRDAHAHSRGRVAIGCARHSFRCGEEGGCPSHPPTRPPWREARPTAHTFVIAHARAAPGTAGHPEQAC